MGESLTGGTSTIIKISMTVLILLASIAAGGCLKSFETESQLRISNMDISAERIQSAFVDINVNTYVENCYGDPSKNTSILLKAYSTETGLLEVQKMDKIGVIGKSETASITQSMRVPKTGGYRIVAVVFEGNTSKSTGEVVLYNLGDLKPDVQDIGIEFAGMDFIVRKVDNGRVVIQNDIYLTNEGTGVSDDYDMLIKAREMDARLVVDKIWTRTGKIEPETTIIKSVNLTVPDQYNYAVEVIIWDNDTIVKRGEDYVQLNPSVEIQKGTTMETRHIETSEFVREESMSAAYKSPDAAMEEPGFGIMLAIASILLVTILRRKVK